MITSVAVRIAEGGSKGGGPGGREPSPGFVSKGVLNSKEVICFLNLSPERVLPSRIWITNGLEFERGLGFEKGLGFERGLEFEQCFFLNLSPRRILPSRIWITNGLG